MGGMDAFQSDRGGRGDSVLGIVFNYPQFPCSYNIGPLHSTVRSRGLIIVQIWEPVSLQILTVHITFQNCVLQTCNL